MAAGLCGFVIGTEILGSIVSPSNRCGTAGLRPTFGRVARTGARPLCWLVDKIGPPARSVEDCAIVLATLNGAYPGDPGYWLRFVLSKGSGAAVVRGAEGPTSMTLRFGPMALSKLSWE